MSERFSSLYFQTDDAAAVAGTLASAASAAGYTAFNPFAGAPGRSYPQAVRLFVAPAQGGWVRVLGQPDPAMLPALSRLAPLLWAELEADRARFDAWSAGASQPIEAVFGLTPPDPADAPAGLPSRATEAAVFAALPDEIKALNVNPKRAQAMLNRLGGGLLSKAGGDQAAALTALQGNPPQWDSPAGRRLTALLAALAIPAWREPDFVTVRDAYQLHLRRQRRPNAPLYHGDQEALNAVPNALDYRPVYAGKG